MGSQSLSREHAFRAGPKPRLAAVRPQRQRIAHLRFSPDHADSDAHISQQVTPANMAAPVADIASAQQLDALAASAPAVVLHFWAPWSEPCKHMDIVFGELAKRHPGARFARVEAEEVDAVTERFGVSSVPTFVITKVRRLAMGGTAASGSRSIGICSRMRSLPAMAAAASMAGRARRHIA